jgi:hypothetical protein
MDESRIDALARTLVAPASRRRTLGGVLLGALATLGLAQPDDVWAGKTGQCKKDCGSCGRCQKGTCSHNHNGKRRCKNGKCIARAIGAPCTNTNVTPSVTGTCQADKRCCRVTGTFCTDACPVGTNTVPFSCSSCCSGQCNPTTTFCT